LSSFSLMSGAPAAAAKVGSQSSCETMPLSVVPAGKWPGQRMKHGTRKAPSQLEFFSPRNGVVPASGQVL
jgi:hypothetical protein